MPKKNKKNFFYGVIAGFVISFLVIGAITFFMPEISLAQVATGDYGVTFGLGTADLVSTVINVVQWVLGFLGLIAVIMIIYGGFVWMTAAGNPEKVAKAKKIIIRAVIGLIIVLLAWAITLFIIDRIQKSTGAGGLVCDPGPPPEVSGCYECNATGTGWFYNSAIPGCGLGEDTFRVRWVDPADGETYVVLCSIVQAKFNGNILAGSITGNVGLYVDAGAAGGTACTENADCASGVCNVTCQGDDVAGTWQVSVTDQSILEFLPDNDYLEDMVYRVELRAGILEDDPFPRTFVPKTWWFSTGSETLEVPPTIKLVGGVPQIYPADGEIDICLNTAIQSVFSSKMRVSSINMRHCSVTTSQACSVDADCPGGETCAGTVQFENLTNPAYKNLHTPFGYPNPQSFSTRPAELLEAGSEYAVTLIAGTPGNNDPSNGIMDVCLNHLDGDFNTTEDGSPQDNYMPPADPNAPWNFFADEDTTNTECIPEITGIDPSGQYHNLAPDITISGSNFGIVGNVLFNNGIIDMGNCFNAGEFPNQNCVAAWSGSSIDVHVPGGPPAYRYDVPSAGAKDGGVYVEVAGETSNSYSFNVTSPQIRNASGLDNQAHGGIGQYVTLIKRSDADAGFGDVPGTVFFRLRDGSAEVVADIPPDPPCENTWRDNYIVIKVNDLATDLGVPPCPGAWNTCVNTNSEVLIQVEKSDGTRSNLTKFIYTNEAASPGLCGIVPQDCGTVDDPRTLVGETFGTAGGNVNFQLDAPPVGATVTSWADQSIDITVPDVDNSSTPYDVTATNAVATSNALPFNVPCGGIPEVVEDPSCDNYCALDETLSCTQDSDCVIGLVDYGPCVVGMASPNPYKDSTDVCLNAIMGARFTLVMDISTITNAFIKLYECTDNTSDCVTTNEIIPTNFDNSFVPLDRFTFTPPALNGDQYYKMFISRDVKSEDGVKMNSDYEWVFQTGSAECPVESIMVLPSNATLTAISPPPIPDVSTKDYTAIPVGPNCTILNPNDYTWQWSSTVPAVATVSGSVTNDETATAVGEDVTFIRAEAELRIGSGRLRVDPDACAFDPSRCANDCPGSNSVCDITLDKCTPAVISLSPNQGPEDTFVTINGCYFEPNQGTGFVTFGGTLAELPCPNGWSDDQIIAKNPLNSGVPAVSVTTDSGLTPQPGDTRNFTVIGLCNDPILGGSVAVPPLGMPGICPPLEPPAGQEGDLVTFRGFNIDHLASTEAQFSDGVGGVIVSPGGSAAFDDLAFENAPVPDNTQTGPARVVVDSCPSNTLDFGISCNDDSDCSTNCCLGNICQPTGMCSPGGPEQPCRLPSNVADNNTCVYGPEIPNIGDYRCVDSVGHLATTPPASESYPPAGPAGVDNCLVCCDPDQDNDGDTSDDPMVSSSGLECTPDVGLCTGNERGLYCGCTADDQCGDPNIMGCGSDTCCYPRPVVDWTDPAGGDTNVCRNAAISIDFSRVMNHTTLNQDNIQLYFDNLENDGCPGGEEEQEMDQTARADNKFNVFAWLKDLFIKTVKAAIPGPGNNNFCRIEVRISSSVVGGHTRTMVLPVNDMPGYTCENDRSIACDEDVDCGAGNLCSPTRIRLVVKGAPLGGVLSAEQIAMTQGLDLDFDLDTIMDSNKVDFYTGQNICAIDRVEFSFVRAEDGMFTLPYNPPDLFTCSMDTCVDDVDPPVAGNQHIVSAQAVDSSGQEITATYNWSVSDNTIIRVDETLIIADNFVTVQNENGRASVLATAIPSNPLISPKSGSAEVRVALCENPWPNPHPPVNEHFPFEDSFNHRQPDTITGDTSIYTNFATWYCKDPGSLSSINSVIVKNGSQTDPNKNELIKEYFFLRSDSTDAIGIRVMENRNSASPIEWYREQFGPAAPEPQGLTVDGYPAVRAGRTVYVAATNLICAVGVINGSNHRDCLEVPPPTDGRLYRNVYLISYNEGASEETINIYNRMLANWEFNINVSPDDKAKMFRDMQRLNDLSDIYSKLLDYKARNGHFPLLPGGTYVGGLSTSKWPSWQETLGEGLEYTLPTDPFNDFIHQDPPVLCKEDDGFAQDTCWDDGDKVYECPTESHIYQYIVGPDGDSANLYAHLEYEGLGNWLSPPFPDPCTDISNAWCNCFNYQFDVTGTAQDHQGPDIISVDNLIAGSVNIVSDTRTLDVAVSDAGSGVNRVEYYVDGIRKYTDDNGTDGPPAWVWDFVSNDYADGSHTIMIRAYDNAGNRTDALYDILINNADCSGDSVDPFVIIITPEDGVTVSGTDVEVFIQASDNCVISGLGLNYLDSSGVLIWGNTLGGNNTNSMSRTDQWDTTADLDGDGNLDFPNGQYTIQATAYDSSGNTATVEHTAYVNNPDLGDPVINSINPPDGAVIFGLQPVTVNVTDNNAVDRVLFYIDGVFRGEGSDDDHDDNWQWDWDTTAYTNDSHELTVYAYDTYNNPATASVTVTIANLEDDTTPPTVGFIPPTPANGSSVDGTIDIAVEAEDNVGVTEVSFYLDYVRQFIDNNGSPWEWSLNTDLVSDGWHTIQVDAVDAAGNRSESVEISVNVRGPGGPSITNAFIYEPIPPTGPPGTIFKIQAEVSDADGVASVIASIQSPDENEIHSGAFWHVAGNLYNYEWDSSGHSGSFYVDIIAYDNPGNKSELENISGFVDDPCDYDTICEAGENLINCTDCVETCNNNGTCEPNHPLYETNTSCPGDCPCDSDGACEVNEDMDNCPNDCYPRCNNNGTCEPNWPDYENFVSCPADCIPPLATIFVTSGTYEGNFGGIVTADAICQNLADNSSSVEPGTWKVWLSEWDAAGSHNHARDRLTHNSLPYTTTNNDIVANNWTDLIDSNLFVPINYDEDGIARNGYVWTGTNADGTLFSSAVCNNWTINFPTWDGTIGVTTATNSTWTYFSGWGDCDNPFYLYCLWQQP